MRQNSKLIVLSTVFASVIGLASIASSATIDLLHPYAEGEEYVLTLDNTEVPTITEEDGTLVLDEEHLILNYDKASTSVAGHVALATGGSITKTTASYGLKSVQATFTGNLQIEVGYEEDYETQEVVQIVNLTSGVASEVEGNYWKITALEDSDIESLVLTYNCETPVTYTGTLDSTAVGIQAVNQYSDIHEYDGKIYFSLDCTYDPTKGRVTAEDIVIYGDLAFETFPCCYLQTTSETTFTAYFEVSSIHDKAIAGSKSIDTTGEKVIYLHLRINGTNLGNISAKGALYPKTYTLDNNKSITCGLRDLAYEGKTTGTPLAWLVYSNDNIYDFNPNKAKNPEYKENEFNAFANMNGGSISKASVKYAQEQNNWRYGDTQNSTFTTRLVANKDTTATFYLNTSGREKKVLSTVENTDDNPYINTFTVNGSTEGVTLNAELNHTFAGKLNDPVNSVFSNPAWYNFQRIEIATIQLKEGLNEITFGISNTTSNNLNMAGIVLKLADNDAKLNFYQVFDINNSPSVLTNTNSTVPFAEHDPLLPAYGGKIEGSPTFNNWNFQNESGKGYRYGELVGYDITMVLTAKAATTIELSAIVTGGATRYFCPSNNGWTTENSNRMHIGYMKVNGDETKVTLSDKVTTLNNWFAPFTAPIGTLQLDAGVNVITFTFTGNKGNNSTKLNFRGIEILSKELITLGA
jgi:hypothetical protein